MRSNDRDDASCPEQEALPTCLLDGIRRFFLDLGPVAINKGVLPHAAAHHTPEKRRRLAQRRIGFAVMPRARRSIQLSPAENVA